MLIVSLHLSVTQDCLVAQAVVFRILPVVASPGCAYATGNERRCLMPALLYPVTVAANPWLDSFSPSLPTVRFVVVHSASLTSMQ